ncbi:MAG TPA: hypothetical protein VIH90_04505 [Candidatus Saccharimonadales bacterium]
MAAKNIWPLGIKHTFQDRLTELVIDNIKNSELWNSKWLNEEAIKAMNIADISELPYMIKHNTITPTIERAEVEMFRLSPDYDW